MTCTDNLIILKKFKAATVFSSNKWPFFTVYKKKNSRTNTFHTEIDCKFHKQLQRNEKSVTLH